MLLALAVLSGSAGLALAEQAPTPSRLPSGYLGHDQAPDGLELTPPPPEEGSRAMKRDRQAEARALRLRDTPRWDLARSDADLFTPRATAVLSCAAGFEIGPRATPRLDALLRKAAADLAVVSAAAKEKYRRTRPFVGNGQPLCTPEHEAILRTNWSYPSGHSTIGYGWALILAEIAPRRRDRLLARGRAFADSRRVCNVHFRSDTTVGMALAVPVVERLRRDPAFRADLAAARAEVRALRPVKPDCAAEQAALRFK